jgi:hypothetical protein
MSHGGRILGSAVAALLALAGPAGAHVEERSGPFRLTLGWLDEPALSGAPNAVEVGVSEAGRGPLAVPAGALDVEVSSAGAATTLPLVPADEGGGLRAVIVPTRPGTYAFHVTGTIRGKPVDARATCGGATFDCVTDASEVQFPAKDPSAGQVAQRLERELPRAQAAADDADSARTLAVVAMVVAAVSLAAAIATGVRLRRRRG